MKNVKKTAIVTMATMAAIAITYSISMMLPTAGTAFAVEVVNDKVVYEAPLADGIDGIPANQMVKATSRNYASTQFSTGVYLSGAPFTMDKDGTAKFTDANQLAIDNSQKADLSYQILDNYTNEVISGVRKTGNLTGQTVNVSSKVQGKKEVKAYLKNNAGVSTSASGKFNW